IAATAVASAWVASRIRAGCFIATPSTSTMHSPESDLQTRGGYQNLTEKPEQAEKEREHCRDEEEGHRECDVEPQERAREEHDNNKTDEQRGGGAERNGRTDEPGTARQRLEIGLERRNLFRPTVFEAVFKDAGTIDHAPEPARHHCEDRADARQQKYRRNGELDDVSDCADVGELIHAPALHSRAAAPGPTVRRSARARIVQSGTTVECGGRPRSWRSIQTPSSPWR